MKSLINTKLAVTPFSRMGQVVSMMSSFAGEKWDFNRVAEHARLSGESLKESGDYLIDVREESEIRQSGYIPNAINIPLGNLESALKSPKSFLSYAPEGRTFPDTQDDKLVFTCQSGMRAARAAGTAKQIGFEKVAIYPGSFSDWRSRITK